MIQIQPSKSLRQMVCPECFTGFRVRELPQVPGAPDLYKVLCPGCRTILAFERLPTPRLDIQVLLNAVETVKAARRTRRRRTP